MPDIKQNEELSLDDSIKVNNKGNPILGRLQGPCADFICSTRNGRKYDESLWEKVFSDPIIEEYFECGGIPGELDHPADRTETCSEKIAVMLPEKPKKDSNGHLIATFDILDTPNGRITYTLAKYGYKLGISSRGSGDTYTDMNGEEHVDEDSYDFQAFDVVLLPAVKSARMNFLDESYEKDNMTFKKAINEALEKSNDDEKKIMTETLHNLNIDYLPKKVDNKNSNESLEADNNGSDLLLELQEALKKNKDLEKKIVKLQEKLSVSYAKETEIDSLKEKISDISLKLSESSKVEKALRKRMFTLLENSKNNKENEEKDKIIESLNNQIKDLKSSISKDRSSLSENLSKKDSKINLLEEKLKKLNEKANNSRIKSESLEKENESLKEDLANLNKDVAIKQSEYSSKLRKERSLVEKYRQIAKKAVDKYIDSQAIKLGVSSTEITNKLSENYSFNDIDRVCEDLKNYQINISKLPFDVSKSNISRMQVTGSKEPIISSRFDDEIDSSLLNLAGLN